MNTGKERTADLNVGSRLQEVVMFLAIVAFFCVVLYGIYRLVKAGESDNKPAKTEIVQLGIPQRIGDGTLNLRALLGDCEVAVKKSNYLFYLYEDHGWIYTFYRYSSHRS